MRKAKVLKGKASGKWFVYLPDGIGFLVADTHAEAMFHARLLADPHKYVRATGEAAWEEGWSIGWEESCDYAQLGRFGCAPNPYRKG